MRDDLPYTYGDAFLFGMFAVAAIMAAIFFLMG